MHEFSLGELIRILRSALTYLSVVIWRIFTFGTLSARNWMGFYLQCSAVQEDL